MLKTLYIKNFALIEEVETTFSSGFTIITGETGAGKSILLGGLSLILGKRADMSMVKDKEKKSIVEAGFSISKYNLKPLFDELAIDYEAETMIRREILPSGKSRAFINDSPVVLSDLQRISSHLFDIHEQHQTMEIMENSFQFQILDCLAGLVEEVNDYYSNYIKFKNIGAEIEKFQLQKEQDTKELDYQNYLFEELEKAQLDGLDFEQLEQELHKLTHVETITETLLQGNQLLEVEEVGIIDRVFDLKNNFEKIANFSDTYKSISSRLEAISIELSDINSEIVNLAEGLVVNPQSLTALAEKVNLINQLFQKHKADTVSQLIEIREGLDSHISDSNQIDFKIKELQLQKDQIEKLLKTKGKNIHNKRKDAIAVFVNTMEKQLRVLGMPNASFKVHLKFQSTFYTNGMDEIELMFSANKGVPPKSLKSAASGGELSRIMLVIKSILSQYIKLPSILFDEIDTGVSGEIALKMAEIMKEMGSQMQVFVITHLPQVAAKGHKHYKVYKKTQNNSTSTYIKELQQKERITELAEMLGGKDISASAINHARQLLN